MSHNGRQSARQKLNDLKFELSRRERGSWRWLAIWPLVRRSTSERGLQTHSGCRAAHAASRGPAIPVPDAARLSLRKPQPSPQPQRALVEDRRGVVGTIDLD